MLYDVNKSFWLYLVSVHKVHLSKNCFYCDKSVTFCDFTRLLSTSGMVPCCTNPVVKGVDQSVCLKKSVLHWHWPLTTGFEQLATIPFVLGNRVKQQNVRFLAVKVVFRHMNFMDTNISATYQIDVIVLMISVKMLRVTQYDLFKCSPLLPLLVFEYNANQRFLRKSQSRCQ